MKDHQDIDYPFLFAVLGLVIFGSVMIGSVSVYDSYRIALKGVQSGLEMPAYPNIRFLIRNLIQVMIGLSVMVIMIKIPYMWWRSQSRFLYVGVIILLILVLFIGLEINGQRGWIDLPGLPFALQPTEFLKLSIILTVSSFCSVYRHVLSDIFEGFLPFVMIIIIPLILVVLEKDLGALLIILPIAVGIYFIAGGNIRILLISGLIGLIGIAGIYAIGADKSSQFSYVHDRIDAFFLSNKTAIVSTEKATAMHPQNKNALIAIGSGGLLGLGFGNSVQKHGYLPEPYGDFIFSIISEELGFIGAFCLILVYIFIAYRGVLIILACEHYFGRFVAFGIVFWILWQMIINISVNMSIFPNTGTTLPFVSYGGSSLLTMLAAAGILLSISRDMSVKKSQPWLTQMFGRGVVAKAPTRIVEG